MEKKFSFLSKKRPIEVAKEYLIITLGLIVYTAGWGIFLTPNNLIGGGVSGISAIVQYATGIKMGYTYFLLNAVLLVISIFIIGPSFGGKTVYAVIVTSFLLNIWQVILPVEFIEGFSLSNGKLLCSIIGGCMAGLGIGLSFSQGGSTGGTDIIALIITKYRNISPGKIILWLDTIIIASSLLVPSFDSAGNPLNLAEKFVTAVYGFIIVACSGNVVDIYLAGSKQSVQLFILSKKKHDEIADMIANVFHRGVTVLNGEGWYTKENTSVLMVIFRKSDLNMMLRYIKAIDPDVFMSISSCSGVYGRGFDTIKAKPAEDLEEIEHIEEAAHKDS